MQEPNYIGTLPLTVYTYTLHSTIPSGTVSLSGRKTPFEFQVRSSRRRPFHLAEPALRDR
jgi:hypothetical protein